MMPGRSHVLYAVFAGLLCLAVVASLSVGHTPIPLARVYAALLGNGNTLDSVIVQEIRLPRLFLGLLTGATLGMAGAALQGFLRNPLAEPGLLGLTNGAALGAVLALYGGFATASVYAMPVAAMLGSLLAVALTCGLAGKTGEGQRLILAGIAVSSLLGACVSVALNLASNPFASMEVIFWLMGSLADRSMAQVAAITPFVLGGWALLLSCRRGLEALSLGEETAKSLGISVSSLQWRLAAGVALSVGAAVSLTGSIGFVGLVVPHILRPFTGNAPGRLLPASACGGAVLLLLADVAVRLVPTSGMELRIGVATALLGAPFFLLLLFRYKSVPL